VPPRHTLDAAGGHPYPGLVPILDPDRMIHAEPLPGWSGRFFHSQHMTFAHYDLAADATPLHTHHHEQEEVWAIVEGRLAITIDGDETELAAGDVAIVPPDTPHSVRVLTACRAIITDYPLREQIPGLHART
jgi:mannose-6-phosphate isomerase-like protein (cupin superfamily)